MNPSKRIVIKIGSALLVEDGRLRDDWLKGLAQDVAMLKGGGAEVVLVSSGSIALGRAVLGLGAADLSLEQSQAAAAVGQIRLARAYEEALVPFGITTAQVLMTLEDSQNRRLYLNSRATLATLLKLGTVPIVNENDTVATDEIRFGDNDRLAAQIAVTVGADELILLSDVDGFYSANPKSDPGARFFERISHITPEIEAMAGDAGTGLSKGGMKTKLIAAKTATAAGCAMAIAAGQGARPIKALYDGARATWFDAMGDPATARKRWISSMKAQGSLQVDDGAARALMRGTSLLPAGVIKATGTFERGDLVEIKGADGHKIGQGLCRFSQDEAQKIKGCQSQMIETILGYPGRSVMIHRDDMVLG